MLRRSFLSLLVAAPAAAVVAKVEALAPLTGDDLALGLVVPEESLIFDRALRGARVMRYMLPMCFDGRGDESAFIQPGRFARFVARPMLPFRPERLLIDGEQFEIYGVSANGEPQLDDIQPCELFAATEFGARLQFHSIGPGQEIVMAVRNCSTRPQPFRATFIGAAIDDRPVDPLELERERAYALELDDEFGDDDTDPGEEFELDDELGVPVRRG